MWWGLFDKHEFETENRLLIICQETTYQSVRAGGLVNYGQHCTDPYGLLTLMGNSNSSYPSYSYMYILDILSRMDPD